MTRAMVTGWIGGSLAGVFVYALDLQSWFAIACVFVFSVCVTIVALPIKSVE